MDEFNNIRVDALFGYVKLDSRIRWISQTKAIGEGRCITYNDSHEIIKDTGWEPTGMTMDCEPPCPPDPVRERMFGPFRRFFSLQ